MQVQLSTERQAQLNEYAERHGQNLESALDQLLADALAFEHLDSQESLEGIQEGLEDLQAGRTQPASEVLTELRERHGLPR